MSETRKDGFWWVRIGSSDWEIGRVSGHVMKTTGSTCGWTIDDGCLTWGPYLGTEPSTQPEVKDEPTAEAQAMLGRLRAALGQLEDALGTLGDAESTRVRADLHELSRYRAWANDILDTKPVALAWVTDDDLRTRVAGRIAAGRERSRESADGEPPPGYIADGPGEGFDGDEVWWATIADDHGSSARDGAIATCWAHHDAVTAPLRAEVERLRTAWADALGTEPMTVDQLADLTRQLREERTSATEAATPSEPEKLRAHLQATAARERAREAVDEAVQAARKDERTRAAPRGWAATATPTTHQVLSGARAELADLLNLPWEASDDEIFEAALARFGDVTKRVREPASGFTIDDDTAYAVSQAIESITAGLHGVGGMDEDGLYTEESNTLQDFANTIDPVAREQNEVWSERDGDPGCESCGASPSEPVEDEQAGTVRLCNEHAASAPAGLPEGARLPDGWGFDPPSVGWRISASRADREKDSVGIDDAGQLHARGSRGADELARAIRAVLTQAED